VTDEKIEPPKKPRGFAAMDKDLVRELARKGGEATHALGKAYKWDKDQARAAGKKGGVAVHAKRRQQALPDGE
jgi:uncharacterized protein